MEIYKLVIQDGENEYDLFREKCPDLEGYEDVNEELVDNFTRVIKEVMPLEVTEEELNVLRKLEVV